jgi:transposase-like protein
MGLCKSYSKKEEKKELKRNGHKSVRDIENNGYLDVRLKKKRKMR